MRNLPDHGLPLVQLKEQRRDLIVALQNRNGPVSGWELMQIAAVQQAISAFEDVIADLDAEAEMEAAAYHQGATRRAHRSQLRYAALPNELPAGSIGCGVEGLPHAPERTMRQALIVPAIIVASYLPQAVAAYLRKAASPTSMAASSAASGNKRLARHRRYHLAIGQVRIRVAQRPADLPQGDKRHRAKSRMSWSASPTARRLRSSAASSGPPARCAPTATM